MNRLCAYLYYKGLLVLEEELVIVLYLIKEVRFLKLDLLSAQALMQTAVAPIVIVLIESFCKLCT